MGDLLLRGVTLADGTAADVRLRDTSIGAVTPPGTAAGDGAAEIDLRGHLLIPAAVEPHTHLDKAFLSERLDNRTGDLYGAIQALAAARPTLTVADTAERAERAARMFAANGCGTVRTHADTTNDHG